MQREANKWLSMEAMLQQLFYRVRTRCQHAQAEKKQGSAAQADAVHWPATGTAISNSTGTV